MQAFKSTEEDTQQYYNFSKSIDTIDQENRNATENTNNTYIDVTVKPIHRYACVLLLTEM